MDQGHILLGFCPDSTDDDSQLSTFLRIVAKMPGCPSFEFKYGQKCMKEISGPWTRQRQNTVFSSNCNSNSISNSIMFTNNCPKTKPGPELKVWVILLTYFYCINSKKSSKCLKNWRDAPFWLFYWFLPRSLFRVRSTWGSVMDKSVDKVKETIDPFKLNLWILFVYYY